MSDQDDEVRRGAAVYSRRVLRFYDLLVVYLSNTFVWRCHRDRILELYDECMGARHLDVAPGTGWYLARSRRTDGAAVTLMDLNPNSLASASARLGDAAPQTVVADVLQPLPGIGPFDSVGASYVFHCVPGTWAEKGVALGRLAERLDPGGVLFGATILGRGVRHNVAGRRLMAAYNERGIFHNRGDDVEGLEMALARQLTEVSVDVVGTVALFRGCAPA